MKVTLTTEIKQHLTLEEIGIAKALIKEAKADETPINDWVNTAANAILKGNTWQLEILQSSASIAKNCRSYGSYLNGESKNLDIWIEAKVLTFNRFCTMGFYLTDLWQITADNTDWFRNCSYVREFKPID